MSTHNIVIIVSIISLKCMKKQKIREEKETNLTKYVIIIL
jgi:hypothetical protein